MAQPAPLPRVMLQVCHGFHVPLACSTLWYWVCAQLAPLPRLCLNTFPSHTLPGNGEGQAQQLLLAGSQAGLTAVTPPRHPHGVCAPAPCPAAQPPSAPAILALPPPSQPGLQKYHSTFPSPARNTGFAWKLPGESLCYTRRRLCPRGEGSVQDFTKDLAVLTCPCHALVLLPSPHPQALAFSPFPPKCH